MQQADSPPAWLVAWREREPQLEPVPAAPRQRSWSPPKRDGADHLGMIVPAPWDYDGCERREPVIDTDNGRVVRKVGWRHCLKCRKPFFSEDVVRLRLCNVAQEGCRTDEDRFT